MTKTLIPILLLMLPALAQAQDRSKGDCLNVLRDALHRQQSGLDSGEVVRRLYRVAFVQRVGTRFDTTVTTMETIDAGTVQMVYADSVETWTDAHHMVVLDHRSKTVRILDLRTRHNVVAAQRQLRTMFPDTLTRNVRGLRCDENQGASAERLHVSFRVDTTIQQLFNAKEITAEIDNEGDARLFRVVHPAGRRWYSTEYQVEKIERNPADLTVPESVLDRIADASGNLRPEYRDYRAAGTAR